MPFFTQLKQVKGQKQYNTRFYNFTLMKHNQAFLNTNNR